MKTLALALLLALPVAALGASEYKHERDPLAARAKAVLRVMENLEERVGRMGLTLRASALAARTLLEMELDELDLKASASESEWRENAKRARYALEKLEKELGIR